MLKKYRSTKFRDESLERIERVNEILSEYQDQKLTARQVYYQFVARGWLANNQKNYKTLTNLLTDARYAGLVDWEAIEDRGREPSTPSEWNSLSALVESALAAYRLPRWNGQKNYVELWVEKQALAGVLSPLASKYHVTLMVNKGYSSASAMKESADRMRHAIGLEGEAWKQLSDEFDDLADGVERGSEEWDQLVEEWRPRLQGTLRKPILFYLGDHDPSGEDMVRDIGDRLKEFGVVSLEVRKLALTMAQIRQFNPPPNPAKTTDSRAKAYIEKFGTESWELDALPPRELNRLIESAFRSVIDMDLMNQVIAREKRHKAQLRKAVSNLKDED